MDKKSIKVKLVKNFAYKWVEHVSKEEEISVDTVEEWYPKIYDMYWKLKDKEFEVTPSKDMDNYVVGDEAEYAIPLCLLKILEEK